MLDQLHKKKDRTAGLSVEEIREKIRRGEQECCELLHGEFNRIHVQQYERKLANIARMKAKLEQMARGE